MITDDHIATIKWCERDYNLKINDIMNQYSDYVEKTIVRLEENNKTIDQISSQIDEIIKLNKCLKCRGNIAR